MAEPSISVVIPTRNRCEILAKTLEALGHQLDIASPLEVIVIDDGSTDSTQHLLRSWEAPFRLRALSLAPGGPAKARNRGVGEAAAGRVLLLGDDTVPTPGAVAAHLEAAKGRDLGVQGLIDWDPRVGITDVMRFLAPEGPQFWFKGLDEGSVVHWTAMTSSNLSAPKTWFLDEPFDETFTDACFEDTEMAYRWGRKGRGAVFSRSALCRHYHRYDDLRPFLDRQRRAGRWARYAVRRHPRMFISSVGPLLAVAPLVALRGVLRGIAGRARREDFWDLRCRLAFAIGFLSVRRWPSVVIDA